MGFVFLTLAGALGFIASRLDRYDRAMRWFLFSMAGLNGVAFVLMVAGGDPWAWSLRPAIAMSWW